MVTAAFTAAIVLATLPAHAEDSTYKVRGPQYSFALSRGQSARVCRVIYTTVRQRFRSFWDQTPTHLLPQHLDETIARIAGTTELTPGELSEIELSLVPTADEFEAIPWRVITVDPPKSISFARRRVLLVAHMDADGDGRSDTLVKASSPLGYLAIWESPGIRGGDWSREESLYLYSGQTLAMPDPLAASPRPRALSGEYIRPFALDGATYTLEWVPSWVERDGKVRLSSEQFSVKRIIAAASAQEATAGEPLEAIALTETCTINLKRSRPDARRRGVDETEL